MKMLLYFIAMVVLALFSFADIYPETTGSIALAMLLMWICYVLVEVNQRFK